MSRVYYRVTHGSIQFGGKQYPQGAEFPASEKKMQGFRAAGVVERITPRIVYRRAQVPGIRPRMRSLRKQDSLDTLPIGELHLVRKDARFIRRIVRMFPGMTMKQVQATPKNDLIKMVIEKRGR